MGNCSVGEAERNNLKLSLYLPCKIMSSRVDSSSGSNYTDRWQLERKHQLPSAAPSFKNLIAF